MKNIKRYITFFRENLWQHEIEELSGVNKFFIQQFRVIALAYKGLMEDKVGQKAAALTYYTLWALIPVLAFFFAIARGFGFQDVMDAVLHESFKSQPEVKERIMVFINGYLDTIRGGVFVGIGLLILFWSIINVLSQIESVFNDIWQNVKSRSWLRKFTDYFAFIIFIPVFMVAASGFNLFLSSHLESFLNHFGMELVVGPITKITAQLMPVVLFTIMFTLLYLIMPNTKVKFLSALIPGLLVGFAMQLLQVSYINSQAFFSRFNTVYSGLVAIPLLFFVFQTSWTIILYGAEISFAYQNIKNFMYVNQVREISPKYRYALTLFIVQLIIKRFKNGEPPLGVEDISDNYSIPNQLTSRALKDLLAANIISETLGDKPNVILYQPAMDINILTVVEIKNRLDSVGTSQFLPLKEDSFNQINQLLNNQANLLANADSNVLLKDID